MDESNSFLIDSSSGDESEIQGDDEPGEKRKFEISRSADIYLIDAREPMFSQDCLIDNNSAFIQSLKVLVLYLRKTANDTHSLKHIDFGLEYQMCIEKENLADG